MSLGKSRNSGSQLPYPYSEHAELIGESSFPSRASQEKETCQWDKCVPLFTQNANYFIDPHGKKQILYQLFYK